MLKRLLISLFVVLLLFPVHAQQSKNVCGEVDYVVPETQTLAEAKRAAQTQARLKAIADEFGTIVSQTNTIATHNVNGKSNSSFNSFSENDVRGIWIEDTKEPSISVSYKNEMMVIHAKVCGKARELKYTPVELEVKTINYGAPNGENHPYRKGYETTQYTNGDFFGVHFKSPINGYVAMFIRDDNNELVYTQLPYQGTDGFAREVKSNRDYIFLTNEDPDYPYSTTTILNTERKIENNTLIVVFSKKPFHMSSSNQGEWFPEIELTKFQKWLHGLRKFDETVQVEEIVLTIKK